MSDGSNSLNPHQLSANEHLHLLGQNSADRKIGLDVSDILLEEKQGRLDRERSPDAVGQIRLSPPKDGSTTFLGTAIKTSHQAKNHDLERPLNERLLG